MCRAANEETLPRPALLETKRLAKALLSYIGAHHGELPALFDLLQAFTLRTAADLTFLRDFLRSTVAQTFTLPEKQAACGLSSCPAHAACATHHQAIQLCEMRQLHNLWR